MLTTVENITGKRFRGMRKEMGHSQMTIARWLGVNHQSVARWEKEQSAIPGPARVIMWLLYEEEVNKNRHAVRDYMARFGL